MQCWETISFQCLITSAYYHISFYTAKRGCRVRVWYTPRHTRDVKNDTYCCFVWRVILIMRVEGMPWHLNRRNPLPCTVRYKSFNQVVGCLLDITSGWCIVLSWVSLWIERESRPNEVELSKKKLLFWAVVIICGFGDFIFHFAEMMTT